MKTKVLVVPTLIIASGFLALNYIKPDFDTYMQKRALRDTAKMNAEQAEATANNVKSLRAEIDTQKGKVDFVQKYLPKEKEQGRMFDSLNFLTGQAGLITSKIQVGDVEEDIDPASQTFGSLDPVADADPLAVVDASDPAVVAAPAYRAPKAKRYTVTLEALGGYPSMKDVLRKLTTIDRLQEVESFKISVGEGLSEENAASGTLLMTYKTVFLYQPEPTPMTGEAIVTIPGLAQPNFDFTAVDTAQAAATTAPAVVLGTEGKSNPFE